MRENQERKKGGKKNEKKILVEKKKTIFSSCLERTKNLIWGQILLKKGDDMNPTTDHFHVPNEKLQEGIQRRFKYQIKKIMEWLTLESD